MGRDDGLDPFFHGRRLDDADFAGEQEYLQDAKRLHGRIDHDLTPVRHEAPGVHIEEIPAVPPQIVGAPTTVTALIGVSTGLPTRVSSLGELPPGVTGALGSAVGDFFGAGGRDAWVVPLTALSPAAVTDALGRLDPEVSLVAVVGDPAPGRDVLAAAAAGVRDQRAMLVAECPGDDAREAAAIAGRLRQTVGADAADLALYWPRLRRPAGDVCSPVGAVAGTIVATDLARGVAKAPAGVGLTAGVPAVATVSADHEILTEAGVNPIAQFPGRGTLIWGARSLSPDPEWRYLPVRRFALFLEESVERGLKWTTFEPNAEPLWSRVRVSVADFLAAQWRSGALQGQTSRDAYFVSCDAATMTQADIANGVLVCVVGFAPMKPAEFVILRIQVRAAPPD